MYKTPTLFTIISSPFQDSNLGSFFKNFIINNLSGLTIKPIIRIFSLFYTFFESTVEFVSYVAAGDVRDCNNWEKLINKHILDTVLFVNLI